MCRLCQCVCVFVRNSCCCSMMPPSLQPPLPPLFPALRGTSAAWDDSVCDSSSPTTRANVGHRREGVSAVPSGMADRTLTHACTHTQGAPQGREDRIERDPPSPNACTGSKSPNPERVKPGCPAHTLAARH